MQPGRPPKRERSPFGQRLATLREEKGMSQQELAAKVGVNQQMIAYWERRSASPKPEQIVALTEALEISVDALLGKTPARAKGPSGKLRRLFEEASALPRSRQERIALFLEDILAGHRSKAA
jgi:transcriptional regulator with XRE-family HTH domain